MDEISSDMSGRLEDFPNELLFSIFEYMDAGDLYHGFWGLNQRLNQLLQTLENLSLTIEKDESQLISLLGHRIIRLVIDISLDIDFSQFPALHSLILNQMTRNYLQQIQSKLMPHLTSLTTPMDDRYLVGCSFNEQIFSPILSSLQCVHLRDLYMSTTLEGFRSYSLHSITVHCTSLITVQYILDSAPNLSTLRVFVVENRYNIFARAPSITNHALKHFILIDSYGILSVSNVNTLLVCMPNLQRIQLTFNCDVPFIQFARELGQRLPRLNRLRCHIEEEPNDDMTSIEILREIHLSFNRLRYVIDECGYRTYTTN